ncbi:signal peptidase I [soil metagenome]
MSASRTQRSSRWRALAELPLLAAAAIVIALVIKAFLAQAFVIPSEAMTPQLEVGDRVLVSKVSYRLHDPRRGDVLVFDGPRDADVEEPSLPVRVGRDVLEAVGVRQPSEQELIKRVIALGGETVEARGGEVYVNGRRLVEPYLPDGRATADFGPVDVPEDALWMMGDNRDSSADSRSIGPVDVDRVVGRAVARIWPPGRIAFL